MSLSDKVFARLKGNLPVFGDETSTIVERLAIGRQTAAAALKQYRPDLSFNVQEAEQVTSEVNAWMERNSAALSKALDEKSDNDRVTEEIQLQIGRERMQQWIIAQFTLAASGLGPWFSGKVSQLVDDGMLTEQWAYNDAQMRLESFGMVARMEQDGSLKDLFDPAPADQQSSLVAGAPWYAGYLLAAFIIGLLIVMGSLLISDHLKANNDLLKGICEKAQEEGDHETVRWCLETNKDLNPISLAMSQLTKAAIVLGGGFLLIRFGLPFLLDLMDERGARKG